MLNQYFIKRLWFKILPGNIATLVCPRHLGKGAHKKGIERDHEGDILGELKS